MHQQVNWWNDKLNAPQFTARATSFHNVLFYYDHNTDFPRAMITYFILIIIQRIHYEPILQQKITKNHVHTWQDL